jgi:predicted site-specific integrase-resolvase
MDNENYISPNKITKQYDITSGTLRRWAEAGKIRCLRPNGGKRIYNIEDIKKIFNKEKKNEDNVEKQEAEKENIQNVLAKLKENIQNEENIDSIANEINELTLLINHIKQNKK